MIDENELFFQKQDRFSLQCGRHSLNNVLGWHAFTADRMNQLCRQLSDSFINPHKHPFGGDYDLNVMTLALQQHSCVTRWYDRRRTFKIEESREEMQLVGFLINKSRKSSLLHSLLRFSPRHWTAVRRHNRSYQFMDSKDDDYQVFSKEQAEKRISELLSEFSDPQRRAEVIEVYRKQPLKPQER